MYDDRRDLARQLDRYLEERPDLVFQAMKDFTDAGPEEARTVMHWEERNNSRLSELNPSYKAQLVPA